ncbi:MAG: DNA (cytosine-5-)-methyltransferase [Planctomycetales bacterium]|nr:MAG: DNA (cytosine-5-)-methyltransferase [Planctomycetales bacterium]
MRFIDLFAGLGGFNLALTSLGHECVFACEIESHLQDLYEANFGLRPAGDIRSKGLIASIPEHDILCAGFPCQPFSKAGEQNGHDCPQWGDLINYVLEILSTHQPSYVILENVPNLEKHRGGETWRQLKKRLEHWRRGSFTIDSRILSPHSFGVPQVRDRMFIVGSRHGLEHFKWPSGEGYPTPDLKSILDTNPPEAKPLSAEAIRCLDVWQEFLSAFPTSEGLPSFPIWTMEFGADYPFEKRAPYSYGRAYLQKFRGSFGQPLTLLPASRVMDGLPPYARQAVDKFPEWKITFIRQNRSFYQKHHSWLDDWLPKIREFNPSYQKLEWNCKGCPRKIWDYIIQFRPSGVRVKRPNTSPSLVAMTTSQVPVIGWEKRFMTPREGARLQSMDELNHLPDASTRAYEALGNALNVQLVRLIAKALVPSVDQPTTVTVGENSAKDLPIKVGERAAL